MLESQEFLPKEEKYFFYVKKNLAVKLTFNITDKNIPIIACRYVFFLGFLVAVVMFDYITLRWIRGKRRILSIKNIELNELYFLYIHI